MKGKHSELSWAWHEMLFDRLYPQQKYAIFIYHQTLLLIQGSKLLYQKVQMNLCHPHMSLKGQIHEKVYEFITRVVVLV
jgi:hypothetical protein